MTATPEQIAESDRLRKQSHDCKEMAANLQRKLSEGRLSETGFDFDSAKARIVELRLQAKQLFRDADKALGM